MTEITESAASRAERLEHLKIVLNSENRDNNYENVLNGDHVDHVQYSIDASMTGDLVEIVLPQENQLQIDYDTPGIPSEDFIPALDLLAQAYLATGDSLDYTFCDSKSGNKHVTVTVPGASFTAVERVAWQTIFGSDPLREGLSLVSIQRKLKNPSLLVELKDRNVSTATYVRSR